LSNVGRENGKYLDMKIVQILVRSLIAISCGLIGLTI